MCWVLKSGQVFSGLMTQINFIRAGRFAIRCRGKIIEQAGAVRLDNKGVFFFVRAPVPALIDAPALIKRGLTGIPAIIEDKPEFA